MLLAASDTTVSVTLITTAGLIAVGLIGVWTAKITSGARKEAKDNAVSASNSAEIARDYAAAAGAKDALIGALEGRLLFLETQNKELLERVEELERRDEENDEQRRAAALLERDYAREIDDLRSQLAELRRDRS